MLRLSVTAGAALATCNAAFADCQPTPPASGSTVTCTGPAPITTPLIAPGATGVTVNINPDAQVTGGGLLIQLGGDARVNNYGAILPFGDASLGLIVGSGSVVRNFGTLSSNGFNSLTVATQGTNVLLSNEATGQITVTGELAAGMLASNAASTTLTNSGRIQLNAFQGGGLFSQFSTNNTLINTASGTIDSTLNEAFGLAVINGATHSVLNAGSIVTRGEASHGILLVTTTDSKVVNSGSITTSGGSSEVLNRAYGVFVAENSSGNSVLNAVGGTINASGIGSSGMAVLDSTGNMLRNEGTVNISGAGANGMHVLAGNGNTVDNRGVLNITGARGNGMRSDDGNTTMFNSGTVQVGGSDAFGVYMQGNGNTLTNTGTIRATGANADGVVSNTVAGSFVNVIDNSGTIASDKRYAIRGVNGQETVINSGTIQSGAGTAIDLRAGNDTLILRTGSQVTGLADGGTGTDITILEGSGAATNNFQNFETLRMAGTDWRFSGAGTFGATQVQSGVLRVDGTLTSPVNVQGGAALQVGTGGASGVVNGDIANGGTLVFNRSDVFDYNGLISGAGSVIQQGPGTLTLGNANTHAGGTSINGGVLAVGADGALGAATGPLAFDNGTLRLTTGFDLSASRAITLNTGGGTLDTQGFTSKISQAVGGVGAFTKTGTGTLVLTANNSYSGGTTIAQGTLQLGDGGTAGGIQGKVLNNGTLAFNRSDAIEFASTISGTGSVLQTGSGTTLLSAGNSYSGGTVVKTGRLAVAHGNALGTGSLSMDDGTTLTFAASGLTLSNPIVFTGSQDPTIDTGAFDATLNGGISGAGDLTKTGTGTLVLAAANNTYTGDTAVAAGTLRAGAASAFSAASAHTVSAGATLDTAGLAQSVAALNNAGTVSIVGNAPGNTLTVNGPYVGNNGLLRMGTTLAGSTSVSDRLVLNGAGATASGNSTIQITNFAGLGALTSGNGIEVVSATNGATTTAQTTHDAFVLAGGHVDAGAYEYRLYAADANGAGEGWYLRSVAPAPVPGEPPVSQTPPAVPGVPAPRATPGAAAIPTYRSEVPLFAALPMQLRQGNLAMAGNLHQRVGDEDLAGSPPAGERRAWARLITADIDVQQKGTVSPSSEGRMNGLQTGVDLYADAAWRAGLYVGQIDGTLDVRGFARGTQDLQVGSNDLRNQYLGGYLTYGNAAGLYADMVLQGVRHRYTVQPLVGAFVEGKGSGGLASIELGQSFALSAHWKIEPQVQLVYQDLSLDDSTLAGATVHQRSDSNWLLRAGVRAKAELGTSAGMLQPYARLNFYRSGGGNDIARFVAPAGSADIASGADATWGEAAAGLTMTLSPSVTLYGEAGQLFSMGSSDAKLRSDLQGSAGIRVRW